MYSFEMHFRVFTLLHDYTPTAYFKQINSKMTRYNKVCTNKCVLCQTLNGKMTKALRWFGQYNVHREPSAYHFPAFRLLQQPTTS